MKTSNQIALWADGLWSIGILACLWFGFVAGAWMPARIGLALLILYGIISRSLIYIKKKEWLNLFVSLLMAGMLLFALYMMWTRLPDGLMNAA